jgi:hypothetical protein
MAKQIFEAGKFRFSYKQFDVVKDFPLETFGGRVYEKEFAQQLVAAGAILYPVIVTTWQDSEYLVDGRRRWLHARHIVEMDASEFTDLGANGDVKQADFRFITAKVFLDINPDDQATWSIILNEERKDNLIYSWLQIKQLQQTGKWEEIVKLHKLNRARFEKFATLDKLKEQDKWVKAYADGKVTEATLLGVAKLGGRQGFVEEILDKKGKVTGHDVMIAKTVSVAAAVNNAPAMNVPTQFQQMVSKNLFAVLDIVTNHVNHVGSFDECLARARELGGTYKLYKLVEM